MTDEDNVVVFELNYAGTPRQAMGHAPLRDEHGLASVWNTLAAKENLKAADVKRVYSEWQPAQADLEFLAATFPADLEITFSFERPKSEREWAAAIQEAARIRAEADAEKRMEAAEQFPFLAILRKRDGLSEAMVRLEFAEGLVLCLAKVGPSPAGKIGISYVMERSAPESLSERGTPPSRTPAGA